MCRGRMAYIQKANQKNYPAQYNTISRITGIVSMFYTSKEKGKTIIRMDVIEWLK